MILGMPAVFPPVFRERAGEVLQIFARHYGSGFRAWPLPDSLPPFTHFGADNHPSLALAFTSDQNVTKKNVPEVGPAALGRRLSAREEQCRGAAEARHPKRRAGPGGQGETGGRAQDEKQVLGAHAALQFDHQWCAVAVSLRRARGECGICTRRGGSVLRASSSALRWYTRRVGRFTSARRSPAPSWASSGSVRLTSMRPGPQQQSSPVPC